MIRRLACWVSLAVCLSSLPATSWAQTETSVGEAETEREAEKSGLFGQGWGWKRYASYGGLAGGGALVFIGIGVDAATGERIQRLGEAIERDDAEAVRQVRQDARSARTTALALYGTGGALLLGAGALLAIDLAGAEPPPETTALEVRVGGRQIGLSLDW